VQRVHEEELCFKFSEKISVKERTLTELLNTTSSQQGVLEKEISRKAPISLQIVKGYLQSC
jgi:hypothetical protein